MFLILFLVLITFNTSNPIISHSTNLINLITSLTSNITTKL
jgi:hypothetical protein